MLGLSRLKSWTDCNTFALPEKGMRNSKRSSRNINSQFGTLWMAWSVCVEEYWNSSSECANKQMIQSVIIKFAYRRFSWHILYMRILWTKTRFNEPLKLPSHRNHTHTHMLARSRTHLNRLFQTAISMYIDIDYNSSKMTYDFGMFENKNGRTNIRRKKTNVVKNPEKLENNDSNESIGNPNWQQNNEGKNWAFLTSTELNTELERKKSKLIIIISFFELGELCSFNNP